MQLSDYFILPLDDWIETFVKDWLVPNFRPAFQAAQVPIGAGGLGLTVYTGLGRLDVGAASLGGVGIVLLAIVLDRITQSLGGPPNPATGSFTAKLKRAAGLRRLRKSSTADTQELEASKVGK